ncbi:hypothetical protein ACXR2U_18850 [Jatrophihabitans sp. YIM 134969]
MPEVVVLSSPARRRLPARALVLAAAMLSGLLVAAPAQAAPRTTLAAGETLPTGGSLTAPAGLHRLTVGTDGNLTLTGPGRMLWQTHTAGTGDGSRLVLQPEGNLVLRDGTGRARWSTGNVGARQLAVGDDGDLALRDAAGRVVWHTATPGASLGSGEWMLAGERLVSTDRRYTLTFTTAGDLSLTGPGRTLWTVRAGVPDGRLVQQPDGNLVLRAADSRSVWASGSAGRTGATARVAGGRLVVLAPGGSTVWGTPTPPAALPVGTRLLPGEAIVSASRTYSLTLQADGNLVLRGPGGAAWTSGTAGRTPSDLQVQTDGNLVLRTTAGTASWTSRTPGRTGGSLAVQDDGHLVLRDARGAATWSVWARSAGLTASVAAAAAFGAAQGERTAVAVLDRTTGLLYTAGDVNSPYASASLVKVFIAARLLSSGAQADPATANLMTRMVTLSDDSAATQLWPRAGGAGVTDWVRSRYGITGLGHPSQAGWWGLTQVTATAMVRFYAAVKADPAVGPWLSNAMAHAAQYASDGWNQWFGLPSATSGWKVKQGWMCCLESRSRLHSTGFLQGDRYTAAILTDGGTGFYGSRGTGVVTGAAIRLLPGRKVPA